MYIGKYFTNYTSYATAGYKKVNSGVSGEIMYQYCGQTGANRVIQCKEGRGKTDAEARAAARSHFCASYGKNGKCYGDPGGPPHTTTPSTPAPSNGGGEKDGCTPRPCPPPSNKSDIIGYWNQMSCQFGNITCHQLPDWGFSVIVGLGGVLLLGLMFKKR